MSKNEGNDHRSYSVVIDSDVEMQVRDGTTLRADIYRPDAAGKYPTLVQRTPYSKNGESLVEQGHKLSERGYVVVQQDIRGRYRSDGEFMPALLSSRVGSPTGMSEELATRECPCDSK